MFLLSFPYCVCYTQENVIKRDLRPLESESNGQDHHHRAGGKHGICCDCDGGLADEISKYRLPAAQRLSEENPPRVVRLSEVVKDIVPTIMAGSATGSPPDSPENRVDPNTYSSVYRGVCYITIASYGACTGVPISRRHILSAGHCFDMNSDGINDFGTNAVIRFNMPDGGVIIGPEGISSVTTHPDYAGSSPHEDIVVITLNDDLPLTVRTYPVFTGQVQSAQPIILVGYGDTGYGDVGVLDGAENSMTKRVGENRVELYELDDEDSNAVEVFLYDFDGPGINPFGGETLGNDIETNNGSGDSGGPSFAFQDGELRTWGINTFGATIDAPWPLFGSGGGGVVVSAYYDWLRDFLLPQPFALVSPSNGETNVSLTPTFDWSASDFYDFYFLTVATDPEMNNIVFGIGGFGGDHYNVPKFSPLPAGTTFYWNVTAINPHGETNAFNGPWSFTTTGIAADLNGDGFVNGADLAAQLATWGPGGGFTPADLNSDGTVNGADLAALLAAWTT